MSDQYLDSYDFAFEPEGTRFFEDDSEIIEVPETWALDDFDDLFGGAGELMS
jgi:hypothetical protein